MNHDILGPIFGYVTGEYIYVFHFDVATEVFNISIKALPINSVLLVSSIVVFFFTKPFITVLARSNFFSSGHQLSGFSAKSLGVVKNLDQGGSN